MNRTIKVQIDLDKIPASACNQFTRKDGTTGVSVHLMVQTLQKKDNFGNDYTVVLPQKKEEKEANLPKIYIGKGKTIYEDGKYIGPITRNNNTNDEELPF